MNIYHDVLNRIICYFPQGYVMELLLTLESVVDNLAECLKNNDFFLILRYPTIPIMKSLPKAVFANHSMFLQGGFSGSSIRRQANAKPQEHQST